MFVMNESVNLQCSYNIQYSIYNIWNDVYFSRSAAVGGDNRSVLLHRLVFMFLWTRSTRDIGEPINAETH